MRTALFFCGVGLVAASYASPTSAQILNEKGDNPRFGPGVTQRWKVGLVVTAQGGPCQGLYGTVSVPTDWPEQEVRISDEDVSPQIRRVRYRKVGDGLQQMLVDIPRLTPGETAKAVLTFEVTTHPVKPPTNPTVFLAPERFSRDVAVHLAPSPLIECRNSEIRAKAKEIIGDEQQAWRQVELLYDWVRDNVEHRGGKIQGALAALRQGYGSHEDLTSLFIALARVERFPARTVWIPDGCYAEFYLQDSAGNGYWLPCVLVGDKRQFGGVEEANPILQKGDNVEVPEMRDPQRFVAEFLKGRTGRGMGEPNVRFVRELVLTD